MRSLKIFGLTFSCTATAHATEPQRHERLDRQEPLLRRAAQPQDVPGNEEPRITDAQRAEAQEIYAAMVETSGKLSAHLDAHWRKLRALVEMLKPEEDEDANPAGLLLGDVADSFIDGVDDFTSPPLYVRLREYAALVGAEAKADTVKAEVCHG